MKRRDFIIGVSVLAGTLYLSSRMGPSQDNFFYDSADGDYDESNMAVKNLEKHIQELEKSTYTLVTEFDGRNPKFARALAYKKYLFTVNHAVSDKRYKRKVTGLIKGVEAIELEDFYINKEEDLAIFKHPALVYKGENTEWVKLKTCNIKLGNANKLNKGDFLFSVAGLQRQTYREGKVSALEKDLVLSSMESYPGDSGSPFVAIYDGEPHIVGITQGWRENEWFYPKGERADRRRQINHLGIKINKFLEKIG